MLHFKWHMLSKWLNRITARLRRSPKKATRPEEACSHLRGQVI